MENLWLKHAKRLHALASSGATYTEDRYDRERYDEIANIAVQMMAALSTVPVAVIEGLVGPFASGYVTPKVDVRGVVFKQRQILLVRERADGLWCLPGGFADVGLSAAENIVKEIREEACLRVRVDRLIGIRHQAKAPYEPDTRDFYKLFFLCVPTEKVESPQDEDILDFDYFALEKVPPLSLKKTISDDIQKAFRFLQDNQLLPFFD